MKGYRVGSSHPWSVPMGCCCVSVLSGIFASMFLGVDVGFARDVGMILAGVAGFAALACLLSSLWVLWDSRRAA